MITNFFAKELREFSKHGDLKALAEFFTRPIEEIDKEIRQRLELPAYGPYYSVNMIIIYFFIRTRKLCGKIYNDDSQYSTSQF